MIRLLAVLLALVMALPADAATIRYYEDPVYKQLAPEDPHPMEDLVNLAEQGDPRAQYILGDLYAKGKGGLGKNKVKARYWYETSARNGYTVSFIRLAALAKRGKDWVQAYKWYTLSVENGSSRERKWSQKSREILAKEKKLAKADIREAKDSVNDWLKKREAALAEDRERAKAAKEEARKTDAETEKITGKSRPRTSSGPTRYKFIKKEKEYND